MKYPRRKLTSKQMADHAARDNESDRRHGRNSALEKKKNWWGQK